LLLLCLKRLVSAQMVGDQAGCLSLPWKWAQSVADLFLYPEFYDNVVHLFGRHFDSPRLSRRRFRNVFALWWVYCLPRYYFQSICVALWCWRWRGMRWEEAYELNERCRWKGDLLEGFETCIAWSMMDDGRWGMCTLVHVHSFVAGKVVFACLLGTLGRRDDELHFPFKKNSFLK